MLFEQDVMRLWEYHISSCQAGSAIPSKSLHEEATHVVKDTTRPRLSTHAAQQLDAAFAEPYSDSYTKEQVLHTFTACWSSKNHILGPGSLTAEDVDTLVELCSFGLLAIFVLSLAGAQTFLGCFQINLVTVCLVHQSVFQGWGLPVHNENLWEGRESDSDFLSFIFHYAYFLLHGEASRLRFSNLFLFD